MKKDNQVYLDHILDAITQIKTYIKEVDYKGFSNSRLIQDAVIRELEIIGEATKNLSENIKKKNSDIPWKDIAGLRDKLIHGYMGVNLEDVWKTAKEEILDLEIQINNLYKRIKSNN